MMLQRIDENTILVPMRAEADDGTIGDALVEVKREDDPARFASLEARLST